MQEYTLRTEHATVVAIDQHARSVALAAVDLATGETRGTRLADCPTAARIAGWAESWATGPIRFVYESGPCGFQLCRDLRALGHACDMIAVSSIPRSADDRALKDDRRDARGLLEAVTSPTSRCRAVYVPSEEAEGARDAVRAYFDQVRATKTLKVQTSGMLLRHGHVWNERTPAGKLRAAWTRDYVDWAGSVRLREGSSQRTLKAYLEATVSAIDRRGELRKGLLELCLEPRWKPYVDALTRLKGVDDVVALSFAATVDDFSRFPNGRSVSRYFGLTPGRRDSGERVGRNGRITKAGDTTVRRAVIEGLASLPSHTGARKRERKGREVSAAVEAEAAKCNDRNRRRYRGLVDAGKKANVAKTAVASELVRQMWAIGLVVAREQAAGR